MDKNTERWKSGTPVDDSTDGERWKAGTPIEEDPPARGFKGWAQDVAATATKGVIGVPEMAVGLVDLATGGRAGKAVEDVGIRFKDAKEIANDWHSDATKAAQQKFQDAEGIGGKFNTAIQNPSLIATAVGESLPSMGAGGVAARGLMAATRLGTMGAKGAAMAGAAGEGLTMAGSQAEQIRQETDDGYLTPKQSGLAAATGLVGGAVGALGGRLANKLGIGDVDTMVAQGARGIGSQSASQSAKSIPKQVIQGAITEGLLEELPQSVTEQILQNLALGKDWSEGVDAAVVLGTLSGGAMGAGAAGVHGLSARGEKAPVENPVKEKPPVLQLGNTPDPLIGFPDGTVARQSEVDAYINSLPESEQMAARAKVMGLAAKNSPNPVQDAKPLGASLTGSDPSGLLARGTDPLAEMMGKDRENESTSVANIQRATQNRPPMTATNAGNILATAKEQGLDLTAVPHPDGGFAIVPRAWVTPQIAAQAEASLRETLSRVAQAEDSPVVRAARARTDAADISINTDSVEGYVADMRKVNTPAAKAFVGEVDAGRITRQDVEQRMAIERGKTPDQRLAEAAAQAPAQADPYALKPSEQMGLDPEFGSLSASAVIAVDSGAYNRVRQDAAIQQAAEQAAKSPKSQPPKGQNDNGTQANQTQQADPQRNAVSGANAPVGQPGAQPDRAADSNQGSKQPGPDVGASTQPGEQNPWDGLSAAQRKEIAAKTDLPKIVASNIHKAAWGKLDAGVRAKLESAMSQPASTPDAQSQATAATSPNAIAEGPSATGRADVSGGSQPGTLGALSDVQDAQAPAAGTKAQAAPVKAPTVQQLDEMPIETKDQAKAYADGYAKRLAAEAKYGQGHFIGKMDKPWTISNARLVEKNRLANEIAELNYWQKPYEEAIKEHRFHGLPRSKWEAERKKRGIQVEAPAAGGSDAAAASGVPAAGGAGDVQADGVKPPAPGMERVDTSKDKKLGVDSRGRDVFEGSDGSLKGVRYTFDERGKINTGATLEEAQEQSDDLTPTAASAETTPFDSEAWGKARDEVIQKSRDAGNTHLDEVPAYVETMRGKRIHYVHDQKVRGVIRTVDNRGNVYVHWDDQYSAEKEMASPVRDGKKTVMQSSLGPRDLKDYAITSPNLTTAANQSATSPKNDLPEPTEAQKEAGNYKKGHSRIAGHDITIENPAGSKRRPEWPALKNHYGYFKGSVGADKDHVDTFMTDRAGDASLPVFVIDQNNRDGSFDEHKVIMGTADEAEARATYFQNYEKGWTGLGAITKMTQDEFRAWVQDPAKTKKPAAAKKPRGVLAKLESQRGKVLESADEIERTILSSIADGAIRQNRKHYDEQVSKGRMDRAEADRRAAADAKTWSDPKSNDRTERLAKAIAEKDPTVLVGAWAKDGQGTYGNEGSMEAFRALTGINLKRLNSADRAKAIFDWAGWSEDQVRADVEKRKAAKAKANAEFAAKKSSEIAERVDKEAGSTELRIKGEDGVSTVKAYIDGLIEQGYTDIGQTKKGAVKQVLLFNPKTNSGYPMSKGILADYAKIASEREAKKPANVPESDFGNMAEPFVHAGLKIQTQRIKEGDAVNVRWVVQTPDNAEREANGERQIGGNRILETRAEAIATAEDMVRRDKEDKASKAEMEAAAKAESAAAEAKKAANRGKSIVERRIEATLDSQHRYPASAGLGTGTKREAMQMAVDQGRAIVERAVDDTAAKKRDKDAIDSVRRAGYMLGMSNENIPIVKKGLEAQARLKANKYEKPSYRVYMGSKPDGSFFEITKTEYDYAQKLVVESDSTAKAPQAPLQSVAAPQAEPAAPQEAKPATAEVKPITELTFDQWLSQKYETNEYKDRYLRSFGGDANKAMLGAAIGMTDKDATVDDLVKQAKSRYFSELMKQSRDESLSLDVWDSLNPAQKNEAQRHFFDTESRLSDRTQAEISDNLEKENAAKKPYEDALSSVAAEIARLDAIPGPDTQKVKTLRARRLRLETAIYNIGQGKEPDGRLLKQDGPPDENQEQTTAAQAEPQPAKQEEPKPAENNRDKFTLERLNRETGLMEPVTFSRGEYITYKVGKKDHFGEIDGISQAKREFSVDGLWHPMGFAYKAERPAAPVAKTEKLSDVIDKVNAKYGDGLTDADRVPGTPLAEHKALRAKIDEGKATVEEFKAGFESFLSNKDAIIAEYMALKKDDLLAMISPYYRSRYKSETKADVAEALFDDGAASYTLGNTLTYGMGKDSRVNAIRKIVDGFDADQLAQHAQEVKEAREEAIAARAKLIEAVKEPKTLDDFRQYMGFKVRQEGMGYKEARMTLTPEQRSEFDKLLAAESRSKRKDTKDIQKAVRVAGQQVDAQIIATKHTKKGHDVYVVQLAERVAREDYETLNTSAKKMGGYYSSFRGAGATPGFQFTDRETAQAFVQLANGDSTQAQQAADARRDAFADDRSQSAVERLNEMADKLEERADDALGQDRKVNTQRRARFAASAEKAANDQKAMAKTMRNIANAIESGEAQFLDRVRQKTQVEMLAGFVRTAQDAESRAKYPSYADQEKRKGQPPTPETADSADFPSYTAFRSDLASLGRQLLEQDGTKLLGQRMMKVADDVTDAFTKFAKESPGKLMAFRTTEGGVVGFSSKAAAEASIARSGYKGKALPYMVKRGEYTIILSPSEAINRGVWDGDGDKRITLSADFGAELVEKIGKAARRGGKVSVPWQFERAYGNLNGLARMGLETPAEFRAALREFIGLKEQGAEADKVKQMERAMIGRVKDGLDFFPTPESVADEMVSAADIQDGMSVLEPSAGMGHIADRIREAGAEPDVIEMSGDRRELLEAKGYNTTGVNDFLDLKEGGYDRIVMNPPFSDGRDIQHVQHAYTLLKPGGRIVALMGESAFTNQNKRATEFRAWLEQVGGTEEKLGEGSFMDPSLPVNTGANARMVVIEKQDGAVTDTPTVATQEAQEGDQADEANYGAREKSEGTPADRAVMDMAGEGKTADEILRFIANASNSPFNRQVARLLRRTKANPAVSIGGDMGGGEGFKFLAKYSRKNHEVTLSQAAGYKAEQIFLHETVHAATLMALDRGGPVAAQMQRLFKVVDAHGGAAGQYGLKNVGEFVAEAFTNPEFQKALKGIKAPGGSLWARFVDMVRQVLGLQSNSVDALSAALSLGADVMRENAGLRKAKSFKAEDGPAFAGVGSNNRMTRDQAIAKGFTMKAYRGVSKASPFNDSGTTWMTTSREVAEAYAEEVMGYDDPGVIEVMVNPSDLERHDASRLTDEQREQMQTDDFGNPQAIGIYDRSDDHPLGGSRRNVTVIHAPMSAVAIVDDSAFAGDEDSDISHFGVADIKASALDQIHQTLSHPGKVSIWDKTVGTMRNLAERNATFKPVFESAQRFIDDVSMLGNEMADVAPRLLPRVESWSDLTKKPVSADDNKAISKPLFEGTLMWGRDTDGKPALVDDLTAKYANLPTSEKARILLAAGRIDDRVLNMWQGLPVDQYDAMVSGRFEGQMLKAGVVWSDAELKSLFNLNDQQVSLYRESRAAVDRSIDLTARADMLRALGAEYAPMRDVVLEAETLADARDLLVDSMHTEALENPENSDRLMGLINTVADRFEKATQLMKEGYAPLSRFGRYTLDVVGPDGERLYFGMFESMREANQMAARMKSEFKGAAITQGTMSAEAYKLFAGITPESLELFGNMLGLDAEGGDARDKAFQEYLRLSKNNHSALKRLMHRKGIAGYSEDVGRVLASFVYSNARQAAGGLNAGTMESAINAIPKDQGELKDVAMGLQGYIRDPQEEGQAVRGMLFAQYLGGSVASAFVNMTQPFAVTLPWLSQHGGMKTAAKHLTKALKDMAGKGDYEPDLMLALKSAQDDGVVAPQEIHQLMAQARGAGTLRSGDGTKAGNARASAANTWERTKVLWGQPFALAEQFNRRSTFIAAYRLAKERGIKNPAEFARGAVLETQFLYSKANKPKWARGTIGGTLFTFKTYSVSYMELLHRMWSQGGPDGKRAVGWAMASLMLMGGAGGLPFMEDLEDLIDALGQMLGYNVSSKQWRKQALRELFGAELAEFVDTGISGLPGAPIDVSGRLGMGNLIPGTGLFMSKQNRSRDMLELVGPAGDLISRGFSGAGKLATGDVAGAALEWSPTAIRNAEKGIRMAATDRYIDSRGYKVLDTTLAEAASKFIGFQPRSVAQVQEANSFMLRSKAFYVKTSSEIRGEWARALFEKDDAALDRVRSRLEAWNEKNPEQKITIRMPDVWKRVREMGKDRTQRIADTAPKALRQAMREAVNDQ